MQITFLGTGNAENSVRGNTSFILSEAPGNNALIDGGEGLSLLKKFKQTKINYSNLQEIFISHRHLDHIIGIPWILRDLTAADRKQPLLSASSYRQISILGPQEVILALQEMIKVLFSQRDQKTINRLCRFLVVRNNTYGILAGTETQFFNVGSPDVEQFGWRMSLHNGSHLFFPGDEPGNQTTLPYASSSEWIMHEACLNNFKQDNLGIKHHASAAEAGQYAAESNAKNLILYHTDCTTETENSLLKKEAAEYFKGNIFVPVPGTVINI